MQRRLLVAAVLLVLGTLLATSGTAATSEGGAGSQSKRGLAKGHVKKLPKFVQKKQQERFAAADAVIRGKAAPNADGVVKLPNGSFVDYRLQGAGEIVTILAEFTDPQAGQIAEPDRSVDNSTYWIPNFDRKHYQDMLFAPGGGSYGAPSMHDMYLQLSSGRYTVNGQVSDWVQIPNPESEYGANSRSGGAGSDNLNGPVYRVVRDALVAATSDPNAGINWDPAVVDVEDRYDCDADGNFNEADGYVDHFQLIHAGQGEEEGGGAQGGDSIWSHRWYANFNQTEGPEGCKLGGYPVGDTGLWVGDYTTEPENGGVGVFTHEYGHDLGLPDLYDTHAGENGTGFWSIMSSGSWASDDPNAIGTRPVHMGAWEKLALGWSDFAVATLGDDKVVDLGPGEGASKSGYQALRVNLPNYSKTETIFAPESGDPNYYYSGSGDNLDVTMTRNLSAPLAAATPLTFRANYNIETDWDYAYVQANVAGTWENINGNLSTDTSPNGQNFGHGITGNTGGAWVSGSYTIPAGATAIRFRYWTDGAVAPIGFAVDSIALGSVFSDNGSQASDWTLTGFTQVANGQVTKSYFHYYLMESRSYVRSDKSLCGAYNFIVGNFLEKQCYADGLLVTYRNQGYGDNNTSEHPGFGQILPVDSHPAVRLMPDGRTVWRNRWQTWDATFGLSPHSVTLSQKRGAKILKGTYTADAVSSFFDSSTTAYWDPRIPTNSVKTAGSGLKIDILGVSEDKTTYRVHLYKAQ